MSLKEELTTNIGTIQHHPYNPISTQEQVVIYDQIAHGKGHLLIVARAGCGKTTVLVEISKLLPTDLQTTFLAFNVHIKKELKEKLDDGIWAYTSHGLGFSAIKRKYKDIVVDEYKMDKLIAKHMKGWAMNEIENPLLYVSNMKDMLKLTRSTLTLNKKHVPNLCEKYSVKFDNQDIDRMFKILEEGLNDKKTIDYTDMIYYPYVDKKLFFFPQDFILIDECQDLSRAQLEIVLKACKKDRAGKYIGRMIFVGDNFQSIYAFAGSDTNSFNAIKKIPNMTVLPLTTTFRCAKNIVKEANTIVSDIKARDNAPDGIVRKGSAVDEAMPGDFILSRKTYPLVKMFFELLVQGKKAHINGSDVGQSLIEYTSGKKSMAQLDAGLTNRLSEMRQKLIRSGITNYRDDVGFIGLRDKVKILRFMMTMVSSVEELEKRIAHIFRTETEGKVSVEVLNSIILSTVHKAKGLEANRVFIIMPKDIPLRGSQPWQYMQEMNLKYIAITRAKTELVWDDKWTVDDGTFEMLTDED